MVAISCIAKFHAFALTEQLHKHEMLCDFYTTYAYQKNIFFRRFAKRFDKENIPEKLINTNIPIAICLKLFPHEFIWNNFFDKWVSYKLANHTNFKVFIGWSGMSHHSILQAKSKGKITILERGSSHILFQNKILQEEYLKFGKKFNISKAIIEKELKEYQLADFISIPSNFVKNSFLEYGVDEKKLIVNQYGTSLFFKNTKNSRVSNKFKILYIGVLTVQKGLIYLFDALNKLKIPNEAYEVWYIGTIAKELDEPISKGKKSNWKFFGHINHYDLSYYISQCDIAVQPSLQEGLSMVIPQILSCGVPVIATTNTGGEDIIKNNINGFIVPIRSPEAIKDKIEYLYNNPIALEKMKDATQTTNDLSWDAYGSRYVNFLKTIV